MSAPQSVSPVEPGGVLYTSSPQKLIPQIHHTRYETGKVATVTKTHRAHARFRSIITIDIGTFDEIQLRSR